MIAGGGVGRDEAALSAAAAAPTIAAVRDCLSVSGSGVGAAFGAGSFLILAAAAIFSFASVGGLVEVLLEDFLSLLVAAAFFAPGIQCAERHRPAILQQLSNDAEQTSE